MIGEPIKQSAELIGEPIKSTGNPALRITLPGAQSPGASASRAQRYPRMRAQIGLYETGGAIPAVRYVPIAEEEGAPTPLDLEDALPLTSLLTPVTEHKEAIAAALDTLQAEPFEPSPGAGAAAPPPLAERPSPDPTAESSNWVSRLRAVDFRVFHSCVPSSWCIELTSTLWAGAVQCDALVPPVP